MTHPAIVKNYECNNDLAYMLEALRENQKAFFTSKPYTQERIKALQDSKFYERELDEFLQRRKAEKANAQLKLL